LEFSRLNFGDFWALLEPADDGLPLCFSWRSHGCEHDAIDPASTDVAGKVEVTALDPRNKSIEERVAVIGVSDERPANFEKKFLEFANVQLLALATVQPAQAAIRRGNRSIFTHVDLAADEIGEM